jgi:outer membrane protein TolC
MRTAGNWLLIASALGCIALAAPAIAQTPAGIGPPNARLGRPEFGPFPPPVSAPAGDPPAIYPAEAEPTDPLLPINLATALRLADARPLVIDAASAAVQTQAGRLLQAQALWLPTVRVGIDYQRHDGTDVASSGSLFTSSNLEQLMVGAGATAAFALTDAIYEPLAERQVLNSRQYDVQTAKNDALLAVGDDFNKVQQARGVLAGLQDSIAKARALAKRIESLGKGLVSPIEVERVKTTLYDFEQSAAAARQDWRVASADLTRVLRLNPASIVVPVEPPSLTVTLIPAQETVDSLIPIALTNRPELASQQAIVQATLVHLKQEQMRPLIPSVILQSSSNPSDTLGVGYYGAGLGSLGGPNIRSDWDVQVYWELKNLGFGNRGLIREKEGQQRQALIDLFRVQDLVAADVAQAHARVEASRTRFQRAELGLKSALASYQGNIAGLSETTKVGDLLVLVIRPQEAVAALEQLQQAYSNYYIAVADYNRAEFLLFHALGFAVDGLACGALVGEQIPVDLRRPHILPPVSAVPCANCPK